MKKKGFTLVELLGVIVILGILSLIVFPIVLNQLKGSKESVNKATEKLLFTAFDLYLEENSNRYGYYQNDTYCVTLQKLVENDKLKKPLLNSNGKELDYGMYIEGKVVIGKELTYQLVKDCTETNQKPDIPDEPIVPPNSDVTPPTITIISGNPTDWTSKDVVIVVLAYDSESGVKEYSFDGGKSWQVENKKTYASNQDNIIIKVRDYGGNETTYTEAINITMIDKTEYQITSIKNVEQGNIKFFYEGKEVTKAKVGEEIYYTTTVNTDYTVGEIRIGEEKISGGKFTMPRKNIAVEIYFNTPYLFRNGVINNYATGGFDVKNGTWTIGAPPNGTGTITVNSNGANYNVSKTSGVNGVSAVYYITKEMIDLTDVKSITASITGVNGSGGLHTIVLVGIQIHNEKLEVVKGVNKYWDMNVSSVSNGSADLIFDTTSYTGKHYISFLGASYVTQGSSATVSSSGTLKNIKLNY